MNIKDALKTLKEEADTGYGEPQTPGRAKVVSDILNTIRLIRDHEVNSKTLKSFSCFADYVERVNYVFDQIELENEGVPPTWAHIINAYNVVLKYGEIHLRFWLKELE